MSRKICPEFKPHPRKEGICFYKRNMGICLWAKDISLDQNPDYFCPHSKEFIEKKKKEDGDKDKWAKYWESKMSGIPMKKDLPKDLLDKLDKAFEEWEKNKEKELK